MVSGGFTFVFNARKLIEVKVRTFALKLFIRLILNSKIIFLIQPNIIRLMIVVQFKFPTQSKCDSNVINLNCQTRIFFPFLHYH